MALEAERALGVLAICRSAEAVDAESALNVRAQVNCRAMVAVLVDRALRPLPTCHSSVTTEVTAVATSVTVLALIVAIVAVEAPIGLRPFDTWRIIEAVEPDTALKVRNKLRILLIVAALAATALKLFPTCHNSVAIEVTAVATSVTVLALIVAMVAVELDAVLTRVFATCQSIAVLLELIAASVRWKLTCRAIEATALETALSVTGVPPMM